MKHLVLLTLALNLSTVFADPTGDIKDQYVENDRSFRNSFNPDYVDSKNYPDRNAIIETLRTDFRIYAGREGYFLFTEKFYDNNLKDCHRHVRVALTKTEFARLGWGGSLSGDFTDKRINFWRLTKDGKVKAEYQGKAGYLKFASLYPLGDMGKTYDLAKEVLTQTQFKELGWGRKFPDTTVKMREYRTLLFDTYGAKNFTFLGTKGFAELVENHFNGNKKQALNILFKVLDPAEIKSFNWGLRLNVTQFKAREGVKRTLNEAKSEKSIDVRRAVKRGARR